MLLLGDEDCSDRGRTMSAKSGEVIAIEGGRGLLVLCICWRLLG